MVISCSPAYYKVKSLTPDVREAVGELERDSRVPSVVQFVTAQVRDAAQLVQNGPQGVLTFGCL
jgi:hypothetical protein